MTDTWRNNVKTGVQQFGDYVKYRYDNLEHFKQ